MLVGVSHTLCPAALVNVRTGGDHNLIEAEPGDLDPHAVASIFKTFLREREYCVFHWCLTT